MLPGPAKPILPHGVSMRRSRSTLFSLSNYSALILSVLVVSTIGFAAPADRITGTIAPQQLVKLSAGVPLKASPQNDRGRVDPSLKLDRMTLLTVPSISQQKAIDQLLAQQQDPASPLYHKWLTPEQYGARFGLSPNDIQKIAAWLQSEGFSIVEVARGSNFIVFSGTAFQAEAAFQTEIHNFEVDGKTRFSNITSPSIPAAISGVVAGIRGLSNFPAKSHLQRKSKYEFPVSGGSVPFLAPGDITTIYDIGPLYTAGYDGSGQTLAVIGETDIYLDDLSDFRTGFGLPAISGCTTTAGVITSCASAPANLLQYVLVGTDTTGQPDSIQDDLPEADLDLEWSAATAPGAQIIYVNAPDPSGNGVWDAWYHAVDSDVSKVITLSYGNCELTEAMYSAANPDTKGTYALDEPELKKANTEGITFLNSSGDRGAAECDYNPPGTTNSSSPAPPYLGAENGLAVSYPASSPEVTGVGGTALTINEIGPNASTYWYPNNNSNGNANGGSAMGYIPEASWNDDAEIGAYCTAYPSDTANCDPTAISGQIPITDQQTFQEDWWIASTGGGPSNCTTINGSNACTGGFAQPVWQTVTVPGVASARFTPDVSLLASPDLPGYIWCTATSELVQNGNSSSSCATSINDSINTYGSIVGGTSASTPIFAGMVVLLNQYLLKNGAISSAGLGNINPSLYQIAINHPTAFNQVTASDFAAAPGSNVVYCQEGTPSNQPSALQCPSSGPNAGTIGYLSADVDVSHNTGYNLVTGLGSVDANNLFQVWSTSLSPNFEFGVTATPTSTLINTPVTWNASIGATNGYNKAVTLSCAGAEVPTTCTVSPSSITPTAAGVAFTVTAGNTTAGTFTFNIQGTDGTITNTQSVTLAVNRDFTLGPASTPIAPNPGQSTTTSVVVTAVGGSTFTGNITFACSAGLPAGTTCSFNPTGIAAGTTGPVTVIVTVQTAGPFTGTAGIQRRNAPRKVIGQKQRLWIPLSLPLAGIVLFGLGGSLPRRYRVVGLCLALAITGVLIACGGGGGNSTPPVTTVSPATAQVQLGATQQFSANTAVTWSLSSGAPGSISSSGLYTAPTTGTTPANFTVVATPTSGSAGSAAVNLLAVNVTASPSAASLYPSLAGATPQTAQFSAAVSNSTANQNVTWAVTGGSSNGTITSTGLYTAPATAPGPSATVTATSAADPTKVGSATVNFQSPTPAGTSSVTVTAAEGSDVHTTSFSLTVNQ
jgi:hypothetical protein